MLTTLRRHTGRQHWIYIFHLRHFLRQSSTNISDPPRVIFSGIQPTGIPHLGNYLGALKQWVKFQYEEPSTTKLLYSVVDLHAITVRQDAEELLRQRRETLAALLAIGLSPERSIIFFQSNVPAHTELMWILSCTASMGYLSRMTQWKSKLSLPDDASPSDLDVRARLRLGLFAYPVLQAADVLIHRATHVPVGKDQSQHLEFVRECATNFNHAHGRILPLPETILSPAKRIMSLKQPHLKMSKSHPDPKSRILLTDTPEEIRQKIKLAMTDSEPGVSYDPDGRPGVSNLLEILSHLDEEGRSPEILARECESLSLRQFKERVSERVILSLTGLKDAYDRILLKEGEAYIDYVAEKGAEKARKSAEETMALVREAVGI